MYIVDSQIHIWAASTPERPWLQGPHKPQKPVPFSKDDALREMNGAGVQGAILVPPWWAGERNDVALEAVQAHPDRFAIMGLLDADAPGACASLANWREQRGMLGIRFSSKQQKYESALREGHLEWLWAEAEKARVPIMMSVTPEELYFVDRVAQRHPNLKLAMDHLSHHRGKKDDAAFSDFDKLLSLAKRPNVAVKASGMPAYTSDVYPYRRVHSYLRQVYEAFGPKRMFWGTDFTKLHCSYRQAVTMFTEEIPWLSSDDKEWIMGRGLCEWLGWSFH